MISKRNLVFFCTRGRQTEDFRAVAERIRSVAPDIAPRVFTTRQAVRPLLVGLWLARRPTVSIEMDNRRQPRILRGVRLGHRGTHGKVAQYTHLVAQGLPVPKWTEILPGTILDPKEWGPYVVVKPSRGKRGAYVWISKTGRVRYKLPTDLPEDHPGRKAPMIAQKFVYTGRWPVAYRVLTYFGRPIMAIRYDGRRDIAPLETEYGFRESGGRTIVASAKGCTIELTRDPEVIDLAIRAHAAVPETPSLGVDIVREQDTGKLFLIEINPGGNSWALTSDSGLEMQHEFGLDFYAQFDALEAVTSRSVEVTRQYAI